MGPQNLQVAQTQAERRVSPAALGGEAQKRTATVRERQQAYHSAYGYLKNHKAFMDYAEYQRRGLPIGSGVTEAGCKTVFTQRFKQSGMSWHIEDGQIILDLRVIRLSKLWTEVHQSYLASKPLVAMPTKRTLATKTLKKAA